MWVVLVPASSRPRLSFVELTGMALDSPRLRYSAAKDVYNGHRNTALYSTMPSLIPILLKNPALGGCAAQEQVVSLQFLAALREKMAAGMASDPEAGSAFAPLEEECRSIGVEQKGHWKQVVGAVTVESSEAGGRTAQVALVVAELPGGSASLARSEAVCPSSARKLGSGPPARSLFELLRTWAEESGPEWLPRLARSPQWSYPPSDPAPRCSDPGGCASAVESRHPCDGEASPQPRFRLDSASSQIWEIFHGRLLVANIHLVDVVVREYVVDAIQRPGIRLYAQVRVAPASGKVKTFPYRIGWPTVGSR
uniref:Uncharacterized protein n=1 Tax=Mycena chlorophos TaxID=658473 RepID=A0ABQ0MBN0_MYCCL|nr:predicted protein [Mycena chlorophos]